MDHLNNNNTNNNNNFFNNNNMNNNNNNSNYINNIEQERVILISNENNNNFINTILELNLLKKYDEINSIFSKYKFDQETLNSCFCLFLQSYYNDTENIYKILKNLLKIGINLNSNFQFVGQFLENLNDLNENTSIEMFCCFIGNKKLIDLSLNYNFNINNEDNCGWNCLFEIILNKNLNENEKCLVIEKLIKFNININKEGKYNNFILTPIFLAEKFHLIEVFNVLIKNGADFNYKLKPFLNTILHEAAANNNKDFVMRILEIKNFNFYAKNKDNQTAYDIALENNYNEIYKLIINKIDVEEKILNEEKFEEENSNLNNNNNNNNNFNNNNFNNNNNNNFNNNNNNNFNINNNFNNNNFNNNINNFNNNDNNNNNYNINTNFNINNNFTNNNNNFNNNNNNFNNNDNNNNFNINNIINNNFNSNLINNNNNNLIYSPNFISKISQIEIPLNSNINFSISPTLTIDLSTEFYAQIQNILNENSQLRKKITQFEEKEILYHSLFDQNKKLLEEIESLKKKNSNLSKQLNEALNQLKPYEKSSLSTPQQYSQFLNKKFVNFTYDQNYVITCLSKDLTDYQQYVTEHIKKNKILYDTLLENLQKCVNEVLNNFEVKVYGSHATNLCLPWSDLDVVLVKKNNNNNEENETNVKLLLNNLYEHIKTKSWVKEFKFLANASTPIIKLTCTEQYDSMSIDISIKDKTHFGLKCVELVKDLISKYESLKPLTLAIKNVLKRANLNDPYTGGISSYGLILMIVSFLQTQKNYGIDISINENNLGRLFHDFVEYYGLKFESKKYIISVKVNSEFMNNNDNLNFNNSFNYPMVPNNDLIIIDPLNIDNNVAKSCFQFFNIKMSFIICLITLKEDCECGCHYNGLGEEYNNLNTEHCFLKRMFNSVKRFQIQ